MHDVAYFESEGRPANAILSSSFTAQADYQALALGLQGVQALCTTVPHPISDQSPQQMAEKADKCFAAIVEALCDGSTEVMCDTPGGHTLVGASDCMS